MVEDAIQQDLIFDIFKEFYESLNKMREILTTKEEKICNLISNSIKK